MIRLIRHRRSRAMCFALVMAPAIASPGDAPSLKAIMQELRNNVVEIADGLLNDDYDQVTRGAASIADHPKIAPAEVAIVAATLGSEMPAFKAFDDLVHNLSLDIRLAAEARDRDAVISGYQQLIEGCVDCHTAYKERVAMALSSRAE